MNYVIGAGGIGSWLTPALCKLVEPRTVTVVDGDTLEESNLDRQLFRASDLGFNKADAMAQWCKCISLPEYYYFPCIEHRASDWLLACVDNHAARLAALSACDWFKCKAIIAANETYSSEAYVYLPEWQHSKLDPRVYYPELLTDGTNNPLARGVGCTGQAQVTTPQLVTANLSAASLALHLFNLWSNRKWTSDPEVAAHLPCKINLNMSKAETMKAAL